jgi:hypothetical protein
MTTLDKLLGSLDQPCGRTTGHGESCTKGRECGACYEKAHAGAYIRALLSINNELASIVGAVANRDIDERTILKAKLLMDQMRKVS